MTYEYQVINLHAAIADVRKANKRDQDGNEVILIEIVNRLGLQGWCWKNPGNPNEAYFERTK